MQNYLRSFIISAASLAVTTIVPAIPTQAASLTWTLRDAVFEDGGTLAGTFDYDAETQTYSSVNIAVSSGGILDAFVYQGSRCSQAATPNSTCIPDLSQGPDQFPIYVLDQDYSAPDQGGRESAKGWLFLAFGSALTSAGGSVPLFNSGELWFLPQGEDTHRAGMRAVVGGEVVNRRCGA